MTVLAALAQIVDPSRIVRPPIVFSEGSPSSVCQDTELSDCDQCIGIRFMANDHLRLLRGNRTATDGFCN